MIGTPMELMAALVKVAPVASGAAENEIEQRVKQILSWVSTAKDHECTDNASRGRLVSLYRALDFGNDGRISARDILAGDGADREQPSRGSRGTSTSSVDRSSSMSSSASRSASASAVRPRSSVSSRNSR